MKNEIIVTLENGKFVLTEIKQIVTTTKLTETDDIAELTSLISTSGYKRASFADNAKVEFKRIEKEAKMAARMKNDVKRQEREAKKLARKSEQTEKLNARIAKMQEQLAKLSA